MRYLPHLLLLLSLNVCATGVERIVLIQPNMATISMVGDWTLWQSRYTVANWQFGDTLFVDGFQPLYFTPGGWQIRVMHWVDFVQLECGAWEDGDLAVINCNAVGP